MSYEHFIPKVWSAAITKQLNYIGVLTQLANRRYEGELQSGNKIEIPAIGDVKISDYIAKGRKTTPEDVTDTGVELIIDQAKSFDFTLDDIDRFQAVRDTLYAHADAAARGLRKETEEHLSGVLLAGDSDPITGAAPTDFESAYNQLLQLGSDLTKKKVDHARRVAVVNPAYEMLLLKANGNNPLLRYDQSGDGNGLREATIGQLAGFKVVVSPYLDGEEEGDAKPTAIGFAPETLAYVSQINKMEAMRDNDSFKDRIRGLHVYGAKVLRPEMVRVFKAS